MKRFSAARNNAGFPGHILLVALCPFVQSSYAAPADPTANAQVDVLTEEEKGTLATAPTAAGLALRARVTAITPVAPLKVEWRHGGEALGGEVVRGSLADKINPGEWTPWVPLTSISKSPPQVFFLTITTPFAPQPKGQPKLPAPTGVELEFEFSAGGKLLKTIRVAGPNGGTVGLVIPGRLARGSESAQDPAAVAGLVGLQEYALNRAKVLEALPWANGPLPKNLSIITDLGGYGENMGYMIRYTDKSIIGSELRSLRQLGVNGLRAMPRFMLEGLKEREGYDDFRRLFMNRSTSFPIPARKKEDPQFSDPCPYSTVHLETAQAAIGRALEESLAMHVEEVWGLTIDEIGSVFNGAPGKQSHLALCPGCATAYRTWLREMGLKPQEFGGKDWMAIRPVDLWNRDKDAPRPDLNNPAVALNAYYTKAFDNYCTARLFAPLRRAYDEANARKKAALAAGKSDSTEARQPWLYSFALRGNTFLMGGHSLDFFEFYRHADNAFVYETSNRDPRIWEWDSYLCDVGRMVTAEQGQKFGIYVKPHRGAPLQRALSALSRGADMIYWYTYGPDYFKGDSFSSWSSVVESTSKAAHLIGRAEAALQDAQWIRPAEVAIVKPFSLMAWRDDNAATAAWEDTKWTYSALAHAHVPVDPIDEVMIVRNDLSRYKVIYLPSPNLRKDAAAKLASWVQAGGTLVTNAGGLARDEANQPLKELVSAQGLARRSEPEMWFGVKAYGAAQLQAYPDTRSEVSPLPAGATVTASTLFAPAPLQLTMGRERLEPTAKAEVLARFTDGSAASVRHPSGKGWVYTNGFYPGLEYSVPIRKEAYDMGMELNAATRSFITAPLALAGVGPVVDADAPTVEGVLVKNNSTGVRAVTLMNWGYRVAPGASPSRNLIAQKELKVTIRGAGPVTEVRSAWLNRVLPVQTEGDLLTVTLPVLEEGDVLLLK